MLWDLIRDFFVMHVFGGTDSLGNAFDVHFGVDGQSGEVYNIDSYLCYSVGHTDTGAVAYLSISDWLSTTATIISITIIVVLCCLFVYKIIKLIGGLIR